MSEGLPVGMWGWGGWGGGRIPRTGGALWKRKKKNKKTIKFSLCKLTPACMHSHNEVVIARQWDAFLTPPNYLRSFGCEKGTCTKFPKLNNCKKNFFKCIFYLFEVDDVTIRSHFLFQPLELRSRGLNFSSSSSFIRSQSLRRLN